MKLLKGHLMDAWTDKWASITLEDGWSEEAEACCALRADWAAKAGAKAERGTSLALVKPSDGGAM